MTRKVFLSYTKPDVKTARKLANDLRDAGLQVWFDEDALLGGQRWEDEIARAIREADNFIALISTNSVSRRGYVQAEIKKGLKVQENIPPNEVYIIPVRIDNCEVLVEQLAELHFIDLFPNWDEGLKKILKAVRVPDHRTTKREEEVDDVVYVSSRGVISLSLFLVNNPNGIELREQLIPVCRQFGFKVKVYQEPTKRQLTDAFIKDDMVVVDASIEEGHIYDVASVPPSNFEHILVVSRTYLPLNFYGMRKGGAPVYPGTHSNREVVTWLTQQFTELASNLPRPAAEKNLELEQLLRAGTYITRQPESPKKQYSDIYISHRARHTYEVAQLRGRIERGEYHKEIITVQALRPGTFVLENELLTKQRHWQILSEIDRIIASAEEMWVYKTPDYLDSWWTQGELVTLSYQKHSGSLGTRLKIYDPQTGILHTPPSNFLPAMTKAQMRRIARWYANSDPISMGPESLAAMRLYTSLPLIGRLQYFNDPVWSQEFWDSPLLPCIHNPYGNSDGKINVDDFLWLRGFRRNPIPSDTLHNAIQDATPIICPECSNEYFVKKGPSRYVWMGTRFGRSIGAEGSALVEYPTYLVTLP